MLNERGKILLGDVSFATRNELDKSKEKYHQIWDDDEIYIVAPIAWVEQDQIDLSINKTILTLKWTREKTPEYSFEWITIRNSECFWGKFVRNVILPENLALNKIKAYMQNNLLVITIPKLKFDSKAIKINKMES